MKRGTRITAIILAGAWAAIALGQAQVGSGHALDRSLQLGSGGYNSPSPRSSAYARNYRPNHGYRTNPNANYNAYMSERNYRPGNSGMHNTRINNTQINTRIGG